MLTKNDSVSQDEPVESTYRAADHAHQQATMWMFVRGVLQVALMAIVIGGALYVTWTMIQSKPEFKGRQPFKTVYTVETMMAEKADYQPVLTVYGEIVASRSVDLRPLVSGAVTAVHPKLKAGETVEKGDILVEVDRFNYEGALREAKANVAETKARIAEFEAKVAQEEARIERTREQMQLANNDLERIQQLRQRGTATQKQVEDRKLIFSQRMQALDQNEINLIAERARLAQQKAVLERNEWKVDQAARNLEDTKLTAPFTAVVRSASVEVGRVAGANDVLVSLYQADSLDVRFTLTDARFGRIRSDSQGVIDRPVNVFWSVGGEELQFNGKITRLGAEIASSRGGVEVFATLDSDATGVLRPGAFVEIQLPDRDFRDHVLIPETAIYDNNQVYVVREGVLDRREVTIAGFQGENAIVASGLTEGDEILTTRIAEISPGLAVQTEAQAKMKAEQKAQERAATADKPGSAFRDLAPEEKQKVVAEVLEANSLSQAQWDEMSQQERRPLIAKQMANRTTENTPSSQGSE